MQPVEHVKIPPAPPDRDKSTKKNNKHRKPTSENIHTSVNLSTSARTNANLDQLNNDSPIAVALFNTSNQRTLTTNTPKNNETQAQATLNHIDINHENTSTLKPVIRNLMKLKLTVNDNYEAMALIDSGAACNCINQNYASTNNLELFKCEPYLITLANKTTTTSNEMCILNIQLPNVPHTRI